MLPRPLAAAPVYTGVSSRLHSLTEVTDTSLEHVRHPQLRLVSAMAAWSVLEPADDAFDWSGLNANVEAARARGYRIILRIMAGRAAPGWLAAAGAEQLGLLGTDANADDYCDEVTTTLPWDPVLEEQYRQLMRALATWLDASDGAGGRNGDHIYLIPVAMPSYLGTEMVIGYGAGTTCPAGTDGAGTNLRTTNLGRWNAVSTEAERRTRTEQAWRTAIDIHMQELPAANPSVIAYGHLFNDGEAAALRVARDKVGQYPQRLWSMYTNLRPFERANGSLGPWREWCPACHDTLLAAVEAGGTIGFQTAGVPKFDNDLQYRTAIDDALSTYPIAFLETQPERVDGLPGFLLTDPASVQNTLPDIAGDRITTTTTVCDAATVGAPSGCTATIEEFGVAPFGVPEGGLVSWSSSAGGSFSPGSCAPTGADGVSWCSVTFTPASGSGNAQTISATYGGDATHLGSGASTSVSISDRSTATAVSCSPSSLVTGRATTCTATVTDTGPEGPLTPSGPVTWRSTAAGSFSPVSCTLAGAAERSCSSTFVPTATGTHELTASYGGGPDHLASSSAPVALTVSPDQPPTVAITSPLNNATVPKGKTITIAASASDDVGIARVVFSVSGTVRCTDTAAPYACSWAIPRKANVKYTLVAVATDTAGRTASRSIVVTAR